MLADMGQGPGTGGPAPGWVVQVLAEIAGAVAALAVLGAPTRAPSVPLCTAAGPGWARRDGANRTRNDAGLHAPLAPASMVEGDSRRRLGQRRSP